MLDLFADRLANIHVHQGIVRLDFSRLEQINPETREVVLQPALRVAMPMAAFMELTDTIGQVREAIVRQAAAADAETSRSDGNSGQ